MALEIRQKVGYWAFANSNAEFPIEDVSFHRLRYEPIPR